MAATHSSLQIDQDLKFQRRNWLAQRIGWGALALIVIAALAGFTGSGPMSHSTLAAPDGSFRIRYDRFARMMAPSVLRVQFTSRAVRGGEVRIGIERGFAEHSRIERVVPEPLKVELGDAWLTYVFVVPADGGGTVTFHVQPQSFGRLSGRARVGQRELEFRQLIYP